MNRQQLESFRRVSAAYEGIDSSLSASAGIFLGSDYHFDLTRPGISIYGGEAVSGMANPMRPVVTAEARVIQVRTANAGQSVSYGRAMQLTRDSRLAIVPSAMPTAICAASRVAGVPLRQIVPQGGQALLPAAGSLSPGGSPWT
jgi:alanine racemase